MRLSSSRMPSGILKVASSVGAVAAVFALAGAAWTGEGPKNDEVFSLNRAITITGPISGSPLVSFDISWFDGDLNRYYLGDRSNKSVDVITPPSHVDQFTPGFVGARATLHAIINGEDVDTGVLCSPPGSSGGLCQSSNDVSGPDGVLTLVNKKGEKQLWVGDGDSRVWALNPTTGATLTPPPGASNPIPTSSGPDITILNNHHRADELCFDSADQLVMVANNADDPPFASIISTETYKVVAQIAFNGKKNAPESNNGAEQCQWSPRTGKFYISIPGIAGHPKGEGGVAVIDPKTKTVVNTFIIPLDDCAAPQGMAVGPDSQILLGCNQPSPNGHANTVIINEHSGAVVGRLPDLGGNDEVWFNPGDGHYFLAEGQLPLPAEQLGVVDSAGKKPDQFVPTATNPGGTTRRAHSVAADPNLNEVYVPIPANTTGFSSDLCSDPTKGCVAIFSTGPKDDHPRVVRERGPDDKQD